MLNSEELKELEALAGAFLNLDEAAVILQCDATKLKELVAMTDSPEHEHYERGRLLSEYETRKAIIDQAKAGSSPAQVLAMGLIKKLNMHDA